MPLLKEAFKKIETVLQEVFPFWKGWEENLRQLWFAVINEEHAIAEAALPCSLRAYIEAFDAFLESVSDYWYDKFFRWRVRWLKSHEYAVFERPICKINGHRKNKW